MAMKQSLILLASLLFATHSYAAEIITTVFNVIESKKSERILVLSGVDGRVYKFPGKNERNLRTLKAMTGSLAKITYYEANREAIISTITPLDPQRVNTRELDLNHFRYNQLRDFAPTDLQSNERVNILFRNMLNDGDKRRSQCFKRAHMWAFDMWSKGQISSQKIFIFYTQRYIQLEDFEWWFHVAPMVLSNGVEYVLDGTFMEGPITLQAWMAHFIKSSKITCPVIEKYQDYESNQWSRLCYLMKVPMYYFSPLDIENRDTKGELKNHWVLEELQDARRAFKDYDISYEGLDTGKPTTTY
jgi:hypothetical protein